MVLRDDNNNNPVLSARDDYPKPSSYDPLYESMIGEIERLRADNERVGAVQQAAGRRVIAQDDVIAGLNEMIVELTKHADAMRDLLAYAVEEEMDGHTSARDDARHAIQAYDDFIREA